jgi:uncharacterized membrane protein
MRTERLNAFTDGVLAVVITIVVLELPTPHGTDLASLHQVLPILAIYALSFLCIGQFWANHHHMLQVVERVDGKVLWANLMLLFWLSLVPFVIRWIGEEGITGLPVAAYGVVMLMAGASYGLLEWSLMAVEGGESKVKTAIGPRFREWLTIALYVAALPLAFVAPYVAIAIYVVVNAVWLIPDRRFERL